MKPNNNNIWCYPKTMELEYVYFILEIDERIFSYGTPSSDNIVPRVTYYHHQTLATNVICFMTKNILPYLIILVLVENLSIA